MRVALDKDESIVKANHSWRWSSSLVLPEGLRTKILEDSRINLRRVSRLTNHRFDWQQPAMMLPCGHPADCRMCKRVGRTYSVIQKINEI
jgi:hypothetical protein